MISCGIAFQIPTLQIILGKSKIFNSKLMLSQWKWVVIISTLIAAIITPSTDPITQLITALPLIVLYFFGALVTKYFEEE